MRSGLGRNVFVFGAYTAAALFITFPLVNTLSARMFGHPYSDSYEIARHIWWIKHALQTGQPLFAQPLLMYPDGMPSLYFWGNPLQLFPAWLLAFLVPLAAAYNIQLLLTLALNGWAMYRLGRYLTGRDASAFVAGLVFMAYPTMQGHLAAGHIGLLAQWSLPLYALCALRSCESSMDATNWRGIWSRTTVAGALFLALTGLGSTQMPLFTTAPLTIFLLLRARRYQLPLHRMMLILLLGGLLMSIFAVPTLLEALSGIAGGEEGGVVRYSADILAAVSPSFLHPIYGALEYPRHVLGLEPFEGAAYLGLVSGIVVAIALWRVPKARSWLWLGAVAWVMSLGPLLRSGGEVVGLRADGYPTAITLPYAIIADLPIMNIVRTPGRFNFLVAFVVAIMVGYGLAYGLSRIRHRRWVGVAVTFCLSALILFDYQFWWRDGMPELPTVTADIPASIVSMRERDDIRAVFHVPWQHLLAAKDALWLQTGYEQPMIAGHVTRRTPLDPARGWLLQTLDPALLDAVGADVIIVHKLWADDDLVSFARERLGAPSYEDATLIVWDTPASLEDLTMVQVFPAQNVPLSYAELYVFLPQASSVHLQAQIVGNLERVALFVDDVRVTDWVLNDTLFLERSFAIDAGFHTVALVAEPRCLLTVDPTLACPTFEIDSLEFDAEHTSDIAANRLIGTSYAVDPSSP